MFDQKEAQSINSVVSIQRASILKHKVTTKYQILIHLLQENEYKHACSGINSLERVDAYLQ